MEIICFSNVCYKYPQSDKYALNNISLSVEKGEFLAVMGKNGSGKSTFCAIINGIIPHLYGGSLEGSVIVDGIRVIESSVPELSRIAGIVLDDPDAQLFTSSVYNEAAFGPENLLLPETEVKQRVKEALRAAGLTGFEDRKPSTLSGGEKQRLSIAAVLAMKSKILVLDDPFCRLDPDGVQEVMSVLNNLKIQHGITIIAACGESEIMIKYADRVLILNNGGIAALDKAKGVLADTELLESNGVQPVAINKYYSAPFSAFTPRDKNKKEAVKICNFGYSYPNGGGINNINLTIYDNDFAAIIGKNGCGKTTLLKSVTGLSRPYSGEIFIRGRNIKKLSIAEISKDIGFVMQNPDTQLFTDSVYNEAAYALKNTRLPASEIKKRVEEALLKTSLECYANEYPHSLSRADRVKTVIACVLSMSARANPGIIFFDEADAGNDYPGNTRIMNIARDLHLAGCTIIFVTHNMFLANHYARRVIKMEKNGIISDYQLQKDD
ncbi:MAG: energy-coupling factor ABC transporter ATP-binding protein [Treponema sp.]|nr:energy-coupling factor ABC transporter ATP-binding protein [Treponema sp.]